ncbi:hypothetical protein L6452_31647 [Arctium lappa]|uniref:Uncharacterized protein n=1 Tax=Arctium lappa TaxID=4217 RepID=A0ACB8Z3I0_ARCLA|nr:hypothetical protein L6452_31647 [Arctium lappa]
MDHHNFAVFTLFLLFAGSTAARFSVDPPATADLPLVHTTDDASNAVINSLPETQPSVTGDDSNIVLPTEIPRSESDVTDRELETEKARLFRVDLTPRSDFARFHAINRHFFDEPRVPVQIRSDHRRPHRHFVNPFAMPRSEISHGEEVILSVETGNVEPESFHRRAPLKRMKVKHDYGHRHHRHHHHHLHLHHGNNDGKHVFDREKVKSTVRVQHKEKKSEQHEAGFMKRIRKFLKHTFD